MKIAKANSKSKLKKFHDVSKEVYKDNPYYRGTEDDICRLLLSDTTVFKKHSEIIPYLIIQEKKIKGRFVAIHDKNLFGTVQIAFFESLSGLNELSQHVENKIKSDFPEAKKLLVGLNGHLNYGAGILLNKFDQVPVFGLPYTPDYYPVYFESYKVVKALSFRFESAGGFEYARRMRTKLNRSSINIRTMNKKKLKDEVRLYADLNNKCFGEHLYWTNRTMEEDLELFEPFRFLLREENILFAEHNGKAVGFLLWFPDFNQLVGTQRELRAGCYCGMDVLRYRLFDPIDTFRLAEIAVIPEYQNRGVEFLLLAELMKYAEKRGYKTGEGGFILEENIKSVNLTMRYIERITGEKTQPYREFALFEKELNV